VILLRNNCFDSSAIKETLYLEVCLKMGSYILSFLSVINLPDRYKKGFFLTLRVSANASFGSSRMFSMKN
jgi:hypothetical protein